MLRYEDFRKSVNNLPVIFSRDILLRRKDKQVVRNQLNRWHKKELIIKLRRGIFILNENDRKINPSKSYIANQLYRPSYVSMEYALSYYDIIPERVYDVTSITAKKTLNIKNKLGCFAYSHIKPEAFRGFEALKDEEGLSYFIATPEKAILDFVYLNMKKFKEPYPDVFEYSYRFQNLETLDLKKLKNFTKFFKCKKLFNITKALCDWIKKER